MSAKTVVVFLFLSSALSGQTGRIHKYQFKGDGMETSIITENQSIIINYSLSDLNVESFSNENGSFYRISIPGHSFTTEPGKPELPVLSRLITIPEGSAVKVKISNIKSMEINPSKEEIAGLLFPAQHGETKQKDTSRPDFIIDKQLYASRGIIKSDTVRIEHLGKIRSKQVSNIGIYPIRYNPKSNRLDVITSMRIEIMFSQESKSVSKSSSSESALFNEILGKGVLNSNTDHLVTGYTDRPVGMIVLTDSTFKKSLEPFFRWKLQKGFKLQILYAGERGVGKTYSEIKLAINRVYQSLESSGNPPEYLLIIGDVNKIPSYGTGNLSDMYYGELDGGGDFIPDMFIGRIPAKDSTDVKAVVEKIIQYEKFDFSETNNFYTRALALAGKDANYASYMNGQVKYAITNYLKPENRINPFYFYYPDGFTKKDSVMKLISNGLSFINYTGHGSAAAWLHLDLKSVDVSEFRNQNMYPFVISNACRTAQYNDTASLGNKFILAPNKGAIGFIGCSNDSYWDEDFTWAVGTGTPGADPKYSETGLGAYDRLFHTHGELPSDWFFTMGQVNFAGNLAVSSSSSSRKKYYWETYSLLGDPSLIPVIGRPDRFNISLPDTLPYGIKSLSVITDPFSYIAVSHFDTLWDASFVSPSGSAVLDFPGSYYDSCLVVLTGQNRIPLMKTIYFSNLKSEFINLTKTVLVDSLGNNNGKADFGERIFLNLTISNLGGSDARNLSARISSTSQWVTINKSSAFIGTLAGKSEIQLHNKLEILIDEEVPDQGIITLDLYLKDDKAEKKIKIDITLHAPQLEIVNCIIDDSKTGNNNFVADPGETFDLIFQVRNLGTSNTSGQFEIKTNDMILTIPDPNVKSGTLQFGENSYIPVTVKLSETALFGDFISLTSTLDCSPYFVNRNYSFRVGRVRESFESSTFKVFPWLNISPVPWTINKTNSIDGNLSAQSGSIGHNATTSLVIRTFFQQDDSLKFFYKVSCEQNYDYLQFNLNDEEVLKASGETSWLKKAIYVPAGINKMEWTFKKDNSVSQGNDCAWIDFIDFSVSSPLQYIKRDLEVAMIINPVQKNTYEMEPVTVRLYNLGSDTIKGFNLAYLVNDNSPVREFFPTTVYPYQDSATVTFSNRADLDLNGTYNITVFAFGNDDDYIFNDTLAVSLENSELEEGINVYPNPFTDNLNILLTTNTTEKIRVIIHDLTGKAILNYSQNVIAGENHISLVTPNLEASMYLLTISGSKLYKVIPLVKLKR